MVFNKNHKNFFKSVQEFYQENHPTIHHIQDNYGVGNDQPILNFLINRDMSEDYKILDYEILK